MRMLPAAIVLTACTPAPAGPPNPRSMAVVGDHLFLLDDSQSVFVSSLTGDQVRQISVGEGGFPDRLFPTHDAVYWIDRDNSVARVRNDGTGYEHVDAGVGADTNVVLIDDAVYTGYFTLVRQPLDGSPAMTLTTGELTIESVARLGDVLYLGGPTPFTTDDRGVGGISRVGIAGSGQTLLIDSPNFVSGLVVDPAGIFWASDDGQCSVADLACGVFRANLDGSSVTNLDTSRATDLQIVDGRMFWRSGASISSVALDGSDRRVHYTTPTILQAFAVGDHEIYLSDDGRLVTVDY